MKATHLIGLLSFVLAAGCRSVPAPSSPPPPVELPAAWSATGEAGAPGVRTNWWEDFEDARLAWLIHEALTNNPQMEQAAARIRQSEALARVAGAALLPALDAGYQGGASRTYLGTFDFGLPGGSMSAPATTTNQTHGVSLSYRWEVDLWGRIRAGKLASIADEETVRALYHGFRLSLAAQTAKAYFAVVESSRQVEVAKANLESAKEFVERVRDRYGEGLRTALEVKLFETEVSSARAALSAWERVLDASRRQLDVLAGRYPAGTAAIAGQLPAVPSPVPPGIPADILSRRPDLVAARARLKAAGYRVAEAEGDLYPRISITGSRGLASTDLSDLLRGDFRVWSFLAGLAQPVFDGGRIRANIDRARAAADEELAAFADGVLRALSEVETSLAADVHLARREEAIREGLAVAKASEELAEERFLAGLTDILSVLESRRSRFAAESAALQARLERLNTRVDLYVALGGGFRAGAIHRPGGGAP